MRLLKHKADLNMQQLNAKHLIAKESRDNIAKRHKTEKDDRKAEITAHNEWAVSTMGYYGSNIVGFFCIFISNLLYMYKNVKICYFAHFCLFSRPFLVGFVTKRSTNVLRYLRQYHISMWRQMSQDFQLQDLTKSRHSKPRLLV